MRTPSLESTVRVKELLEEFASTDNRKPMNLAGPLTFPDLEASLSKVYESQIDMNNRIAMFGLLCNEISENA